MFYHYFKSKDELFDRVVDRFFQRYEEKCGALIRQCASPEQFIDAFLPMYADSMGEFGKLRGKMHWTALYAMAAKTVMSLRPVVADMISEWKTGSDTAPDILAGQLLYGISATIHSEDFAAMGPREQRGCLLSFIGKVLA